jgi:hypothetical protein
MTYANTEVIKVRLSEFVAFTTPFSDTECDDIVTTLETSLTRFFHDAYALDNIDTNAPSTFVTNNVAVLTILLDAFVRNVVNTHVMLIMITLACLEIWSITSSVIVVFMIAV